MGTRRDTEFSVYLSFLLRHKPETIGLTMDKHGWVSVNELIAKVSAKSKYRIDINYLSYIVDTDSKGRYRFNDNRTRIKACQGHSIPWVEPEVLEATPPHHLYHGTTADAYMKIIGDGYISKMSRHAVHMHETQEEAERSAKRWHKDAVIIRIRAKLMSMSYDRINGGMYKFFVSENGIWLTDRVPMHYADKVIRL